MIPGVPREPCVEGLTFGVARAFGENSEQRIHLPAAEAACVLRTSALHGLQLRQDAARGACAVVVDDAVLEPVQPVAGRQHRISGELQVGVEKGRKIVLAVHVGPGRERFKRLFVPGFGDRRLGQIEPIETATMPSK